jgi:hypothetical protein
VRNRGGSPFPSLHRVETSSTTQGSVQSVVDGDPFAFPQARSDPGTNFRSFAENEGVKKSLPFTCSVEFNRRSPKKCKWSAKWAWAATGKAPDKVPRDRYDGQHKPLKIENDRQTGAYVKVEHSSNSWRTSSDDDDHRDDGMWLVMIVTICLDSKNDRQNRQGFLECQTKYRHFRIPGPEPRFEAMLRPAARMAPPGS